MEDNKLITIENEQKSILEQIQEITINNEEDNVKAGNFLKQIKPVIKNIKEYWKPLKESAKKAHSDLCAREKTMLEPLEQAETQIKAKMSVYITEQEEKAKREQEALRKAQEEEALKQLAEAEKLKAEGKEFEAQMQEEMAYAIDEVKTVVQPTIQKQEGISYMTDYSVVITDANKVPTYVNGIEIRPIDVQAIKKLAKASKGQIQIEGIKILEKKIMKVRS